MSQDLNTILAALNVYLEQGMGIPANRSDEIHDIATNGGNETSMDDDGIDNLCERLNTRELVLIDARTLAALAQRLDDDVIGADVFMEPTSFGSGDCYDDDCKRVEAAGNALQAVTDELRNWVPNTFNA